VYAHRSQSLGARETGIAHRLSQGAYRRARCGNLLPGNLHRHIEWTADGSGGRRVE